MDRNVKRWLGKYVQCVVLVPKWTAGDCVRCLDCGDYAARCFSGGRRPLSGRGVQDSAPSGRGLLVGEMRVCLSCNEGVGFPRPREAQTRLKQDGSELTSVMTSVCTSRQGDVSQPNIPRSPPPPGRLQADDDGPIVALGCFRVWHDVIMWRGFWNAATNGF